MNLQQWRENNIKPLTLPSGLDVKVREVKLLDLAFNGNIPVTLNGMLESLLNKPEVKADELAKFGELVNMVVKAAMIEPAVADVADDTHVAVQELPAEDRLHIFNWANREATQLTQFRNEG